MKRAGLRLLASVAGLIAMVAGLKASDGSARATRPPVWPVSATGPASAPPRLAAALPCQGVLRAIAVDVDADGDLDFVATTNDELLVVWVNDGTGRLIRTHRRSAPLMSSLPGLGGSAPGAIAVVTPSKPGASGAALSAAHPCNHRSSSASALASPCHPIARQHAVVSDRAPPVQSA